jgi:hypothetical protein
VLERFAHQLRERDAALVAYSRVHTGVHYPGDVVAGARRSPETTCAPGSVAAVLRYPKAAVVALLACLALAGVATDAAAATLLRLNGIGPLHLGMTRADALATGWLAHRTTGCPLGGPPLPIVYRLSGPSAPSGVRGTAEFDRGRLRTLSFTRGVRTAVGVVVGRTTTSDMVARYRAAGFRARATFEEVFAGTFVTVKRPGSTRFVISGFADADVVTTLGIPAVPVCE